MAVQLVLLRLAGLGYPVQPDYAAQSAGMVPRLQHLHVGSSSHVSFPALQVSATGHYGQIGHLKDHLFLLLHQMSDVQSDTNVHRCQAAAQNFDALVALRVLSGAFEAIADPA